MTSDGERKSAPPAPRTREEVLALAEQLQVRFVRLQFVDILGIHKSVAIPVTQLEKALDGELMFDGSSVEGFVRIEESDMLLRPDPETFAIYPWKTTPRGTTARLMCDVYNPDGTPFAGCPRNTLKRNLARAEAMGFRMMVGPEAEFFLFQRDENGKPTTITHDQGSYFDLSPIDRGEDARRDMVLILQELGFDVERSSHEVAPGQHEIDFQYADAVTTADRLMTLKLVVRHVAMEHGLHATFMPKPLFGVNGSGMHVHLSLFRGDTNAFFDPDASFQLSRIAMHFIAGLMHHARGYTAVTNPLVNSYKRLVPGYEAPAYIAWSEQNRSPLVRVPSRRGRGTRVELRSPDPSCNPYLAFAVILAAGLDGIERRLEPPPPVNRNIYRMSVAERMEANIDSLPANLEEALDELERDEVIREALGEHIFTHFMEAKRIEWDVYRKQVHPWEVEQYLTVF